MAGGAVAVEREAIACEPAQPSRGRWSGRPSTSESIAPVIPAAESIAHVKLKRGVELDTTSAAFWPSCATDGKGTHARATVLRDLS